MTTQNISVSTSSSLKWASSNTSTLQCCLLPTTLSAF